MGNFSIEYATIADADNNHDYHNAQYYLLGATSIAAILPHNYSLTLSQKWLGKNSDQARAEVNSVLRRTMLDNYEEKSANYYLLRYKQLPRMSKDFAPTLSVTELASAETYMHNNCYSCHKMNVPQFSKALNRCQWGDDSCVVNSENYVEIGIPYASYRTPSAIFAGNINNAIETLPAALDGLYMARLYKGTEVKQSPARIQIAGRKSLSRWDQLSWLEALSAVPPAPRYAVLSPLVDINGNVQPREKMLNFDLDGDGTISIEKAVCKKSATFSISGQTLSCREVLTNLFGATPRLLGESDIVNQHATVVRPSPSELLAVSKYLACASREICRITEGSSYLTVHSRALGYFNGPNGCRDASGTNCDTNPVIGPSDAGPSASDGGGDMSGYDGYGGGDGLDSMDGSEDMGGYYGPSAPTATDGGDAPTATDGGYAPSTTDGGYAPPTTDGGYAPPTTDGGDGSIEEEYDNYWWNWP